MTFGCEELTESGFGVDFGEFSDIKSWLSYWFDHTTLINEDDPELQLFQDLHDKQIVDLRVLPNVSMERTAEFVFDYVDKWIREQTNNRSFLIEVECRENNKKRSDLSSPCLMHLALEPHATSTQSFDWHQRKDQ